MVFGRKANKIRTCRQVVCAPLHGPTTSQKLNSGETMIRRLTVLLTANLTCMALAWSLDVCLVAQGQDWSHWRGPLQTGVSPDLNLVDKWSLGDEPENVLWVSDVGGRATPVVINGRVYLNCRTEHDVNDPDEVILAGEQVICRDAMTGEELWRDVFNVFQTDIPAPRVGWAAMCGDTETGNVYLHSVSGLFRCYDADGNVLWEKSLAEEFGKISGYGGRTHTPVIDEDKVIISFLSANWGDSKGPGPAHTYYAFDKKTGDLIWVSAPGGTPLDTTYSAPVVAVINGQRLLIGGNADGGIYAMQARTGKKVWGFQMSKRGLNTTPVVEGNLVYISHGEDNIDTTEFGRIQCIDGSLSGDITQSGSVWRLDGIKAGYTALLIRDGILYVVSDTGKLYALDSKTGDELWTQSIGTVGKGSPVWGDDKIYVMEVNGNIWTLKPSREGCQVLNHVELHAADGVSGMDEIYASPAIADGRVYFVTRDRTICVGLPDAEPKAWTLPEMPAEKPTADEIATLLLVPFEVEMMAGESASFELRAFDANGNFISTVEPDNITFPDPVSDVEVDGTTITITAPVVSESLAGNITASGKGQTANGRIRVFSDQAEWSWDFEGYKPMQVPATWVRAFAKLKPEQIGPDGNIALKSGGMDAVRRRPSHLVWIGPPEMTDYTVQSDVYFTEQKRRLSSMGITANRYNLILKANNNKLELQSWPAHLRLRSDTTFRVDPDTWYTMKLKVKIDGDQALLFGKVWKRDEPEPEAWTIQTVDPRANKNGSPGLYIYALADSYFDNVRVTRNDH